MTRSTATPEEQVRFVAWMVGYAVAAAVLLMVVAVLWLTAVPGVVVGVALGGLLSTGALGFRHLLRAVSPFAGATGLR